MTDKGKGTNIYTPFALKARIERIAEVVGRSKTNTLSYLCDLFDHTTAVEQAHILSGELWRPDAQEAR